MYARGMSTREIVGHLRDLYGIEVSPDLISAVTDAVLEEVAAWQARPLEEVYPLIFFDALRSRSAMKGWSATRRCISRWAYALTAPRKSSASGSSKMRVPNSGCAS
jgi:putative transposase